MVVKDPLECRIAAVSCQNLEQMYVQDVIKTVVDGNRYLDRQETVRIFSALAK